MPPTKDYTVTSFHFDSPHVLFLLQVDNVYLLLTTYIFRAGFEGVQGERPHMALNFVSLIIICMCTHIFSERKEYIDEKVSKISNML